MRLLAGVLHSDEIVWNSYTWDADAHKQINTKTKTTSITLDKGNYLYSKIYVKKCGNVVQIFLNGISKLSSLKNTVLATLPVGYRPKLTVSWSCIHPDGRTYRITINTDGEIIGYNYATDENNTNAVDTFTFVID